MILKELMNSYSQNPNLGTWNVNFSANSRGGYLEISIVMGKFGMELINERVWTSFFQEISITWTHKLGLTWTEKSLYINGFMLKTPRRKQITHRLLSGRSQVQLPPGTPAKLIKDHSLIC